MKKLLLLFTLIIALLSCDDDDKVTLIDYGTKTFEADLEYDSSVAHGQIAYKQQVYFRLGDTTAIATGEYDTDSWTQFYLIPDSSQTNLTSDVEDWDIVFTSYVENLGTETEPYEYNVTGALINTKEEIQVGMYEYTEYDATDSISKAFSNLSISDISDLTYSSEVNAIGYEWKTLNHSTYTYVLNTNEFFIIKLISGDYYKLRFVGFYGDTTADRIIKIEYALMQ